MWRPGRCLSRELLQLSTGLRPTLPTPHIPSCSSSSLINLAPRFWPASHDVEGAGLSDHPPGGEAFVCPPSRHLLLFMPPASFSEAIFQLPYNNEESILIEVFKALRLMALGVNFCLVFFFCYFFFLNLQGSVVDLGVLPSAIVFLSTPIIPSLSFVLLLVY